MARGRRRHGRKKKL